MVNALNLSELDQEQALNLAKFYIKSNNNLFFWGQRGTGKTQISIQAIRECNYKVNYINLSVIEKNDLLGYPNLFNNSELIEFKSPVFLPPLKGKADSVILFDEVDKANPEITAPLLEILQFRTINNKPINAVCCILTGNLTSEGAYSNLVSTALLDRGAKYILAFNFEKWLEWGKLNNINDLILGFLKSNPEFTCGKADDISYASPSPRGWTLASEAITKAKEHKIIDIESISNIVSGFVGGQAGLKFKIWYEYFRKFEIYSTSLIEAGIMNLNYNELLPTEKLVFVISTCYLAKQKFLSSKFKTIYLENLCKFFENTKIDPEVQVMGMSNSFTFEFITKYKLYTCKPFFDLFTKLTQNLQFKK